jgi:hypothetical protein
MEISPVGAADGQTDMTKLTGTVPDYVKAPNKRGLSTSYTETPGMCDSSKQARSTFSSLEHVSGDILNEKSLLTISVAKPR